MKTPTRIAWQETESVSDWKGTQANRYNPFMNIDTNNTMAPCVIFGERAGENTQRRLQMVNPHSELGTRPPRFGHEDENNAHIQVRGENGQYLWWRDRNW
jgi:hypothetical protein